MTGDAHTGNRMLVTTKHVRQADEQVVEATWPETAVSAMKRWISRRVSTTASSPRYWRG
jgi:hypothetical protein